jgi:hypothetical protein
MFITQFAIICQVSSFKDQLLNTIKPIDNDSFGTTVVFSFYTPLKYCQDKSYIYQELLSYAVSGASVDSTS